MSPPRLVTVGEVMLRLSPPPEGRLSEPVPHYECFFGGSECNTAVALASMDVAVELVSAFPPGPIGDAAIASVARTGVDTGRAARIGGRLGLYYVELASGERPMRVVYDRADSAMAMLEPDAIDWAAVLDGADWLHWSGITPALSSRAERLCAEAITAAGRLDLPVSCDLNHRAQLWVDDDHANRVMDPLLAECTVLIGNARSYAAMAAIHVGDAAVGDVPGDTVAAIRGRYGNVSTAVLTERSEQASDRHEFTATMDHGGSLSTVTTQLENIVDRVGGGDAFTAGLLFGLLHHPDTPATNLEFAATAGALKHGVPGDWHTATVADVREAQRHLFGT